MYELYQGVYHIRVWADMVTRLHLLPELDMTPAAMWENPWEYVYVRFPRLEPSGNPMAAIAASEQL